MSTVFRVEKTKDFTVMSNYHLRNKKMSLKAKGLLSLMLSLPEDWDYTQKGLSKINHDGVCSISNTIDELIRFGYLEVNEVRNEKGHFVGTEYIIHEKPIISSDEEPDRPKSKKAKSNKKSKAAKSSDTNSKNDTVTVHTPTNDNPTDNDLIDDNPIDDNPNGDNPTGDNPNSDNPKSENPVSDNPHSENHEQINNNKTNKNKKNTDCIKYQSINHTSSVGTEKDRTVVNAAVTEPDNSDRWIDKYNKTVAAIKKQISYDDLIISNEPKIINEILSIMTEVFLVDTPYYKIEGRQVRTEYVRINYRKVTYEGIETLLLDFYSRHDRINNSKKYLTTALYNIANSAETSLTNRVNHDMYGGR